MIPEERETLAMALVSGVQPCASLQTRWAIVDYDLLTAAAAELRKTCDWSDDDGAWKAGCLGGRLFEFNDCSGPSANHFLFCPYCGGSLEEVTFDPDEGDEDSES